MDVWTNPLQMEFKKSLDNVTIDYCDPYLIPYGRYHTIREARDFCQNIITNI